MPPRPWGVSTLWCTRRASGPLAHLADIDAETWRQTFATNVTGAALTTAAALPHLKASSGVRGLSVLRRARRKPHHGPGWAPMRSSKAALEKLVEAWRAEHPQVGFTRVIVGDCAGGDGDGATEFASAWDPDLATDVMPIWVTRNYIAGNLLEVERAGGRGRQRLAPAGPEAASLR